MGVNTGHHLTEAGLIPADWIVRNVRSFASIKTGPFGTLLKASEYTEGDGVPLISVGEIREGFFRITSETPKVCEKVTRRLPQYLLRTGDIVFGRKGGVERSALVSERQTGWFLGSDGIAVRPDGTVFSPYLSRQFQTTRVRNWLLQNSTGTTMPSLNQAILGSVVVALPPTRPEQEAIAGALADADAWIESLEKLIAKKRQIKLGVMQQLLTAKRRLPGFSGEWKERLLGDHLRMQVGFPFSSAFFNESGHGIRLIKNRDLKGDDQCVHYAGPFDSEYLVRNGDVLVGMDGEFLSCMWRRGAALLNQRIGRLVAKREIDLCYMYYRLADPLRQIESATAGTTVKHLSHGDIEALRLPLPEINEQTAIGTVLSDTDSEIDALETKLVKARLIKQGMMQTLLTGKVRLA